MVDIRPDAVINTAAFHNVPLCEIEVEQAFRINCAAVRDIAASCKKNGALFVTFSSDYVFGGEKNIPYLEGDRPQPLQIYGISRLAGELAAIAVAPENSVIIRTCGLYGTSGAQSKGGNFVDKRIQDALTSFPLWRWDVTKLCHPTSTDDLSRAVLQLIMHQKCAPGIYHLVNEGECTWYEFTKAIYEIAGLDVTVIPVDRGGMSGDMRRPLYSALANTKARALGIALPSWRTGLKQYITGKYGAGSNI